MARISGIDLARDKRIDIGLTRIYGIGRNLAHEILDKAQVSPDLRVKDLTDQQVTREPLDLRTFDLLADRDEAETDMHTRNWPCSH